MSYLLETLGRGLPGRLFDVFERQFPGSPEEDAYALAERWELSPTSFDLTVRLAVAHLRKEQQSSARAAFAAARELDGESRLPTLGLACVHDDLGQIDSAAVLLKQAQTQDAGDPAIAFGIGFCDERLGEVASSVKWYQRAVKLCPQLRNGHERLAAIAVRNGEWDAALRAYLILSDLEPDDLNVLISVGGLYLQAGRPDEAIETFQRALLVEPETASDSLDAAEELEDDGMLVQAIGSMEQMVSKYPGMSEFHVHLADLYVKAGDDQRAVHQYQAALEIRPNFLEATVKLGTQHLRRQRYADAAEAFTRAVELNDRMLTAFVGLGVAQHAAGWADEAHASFDLAVSLAPNSTLLFSETNRLRLRSERERASVDLLYDDCDVAMDREDLLTEALRRHRQMIALHPNRADLRYRYGQLLRQVGYFQAAAEAHREALQLNPAFGRAQIKLGIALRELGEDEAAIESFRRALDVSDRQIRAHYELAVLYAKPRQFDLALERFESSLPANMSVDDFHANLILSLEGVGMVDRAAVAWNSTCELTRDGIVDTCSGRFTGRGTDFDLD